jgi:hypothetical protein
VAVQLEADEHDAAFKNVLCDPGGSGMDSRFHVVPFQPSANAWFAPEPSRYAPTAIHAEDEVHETPLRMLTGAPGGFGVARRLQLVPFPRSAKLTPVPDPST